MRSELVRELVASVENRNTLALPQDFGTRRRFPTRAAVPARIRAEKKVFKMDLLLDIRWPLHLPHVWTRSTRHLRRPACSA